MPQGKSAPVKKALVHGAAPTQGRLGPGKPGLAKCGDWSGQGKGGRKRGQEKVTLWAGQPKEGGGAQTPELGLT